MEHCLLLLVKVLYVVGLATEPGHLCGTSAVI